MTEVEAGCQFRPTLAVVAIINIKGIDAGTDDFGFLTDNPIPGIQVATGDVVGYGVEIRKQALTDYRGYFFSPASTDKFRFWFGAGIFEQRAVHLSAAPPGQTYIGVTSVRGGTQDYLRLSLGVDVKIRRTGLVVQAGVAGMLHLSGWLLEVQTGTASQFEGSGVVGSGAAQAIAGMAYHF